MLIKRTTKRQDGFTITEMVVALALFGLAVVTIMGTMNTLQQAQRSERYLDLANTAARKIVEQSRNGSYDGLAVGTYNLASSVTDELPGKGATLVVSSSSSLPDIKKLEVDVSYKVGTVTRHVYTTALIGKGGISP